MDNQKMGIYIAAKRKERQMTQTDLAQQLHITRQAVSKWESGKSVPDPETLLAMAALFQVTVEEILGGEDVPTDPPVPMEVPAPVNGPVYVFQKTAPSQPPEHHPIIRRATGWLFWIPAILAAVFLGLLPIAQVGYLSLTAFNVLEVPRFVGLQNYITMLQDPLMQQSLLNTLFILLLAGGIALLLGWLFGSAAARLPLPIGIVIGILLSIGSLCALFPSWISLLFSSDSYGLLNAMLLDKGIIQTPILWTQLHANEIQVLILALLSLAPSYLIFFIAGRSNRRRAAWHIAVTAVPVIILAGWMVPLSTIGYPSVNYQAHWLPGMIYDYGGIRFEIGTSCALLVICLWLTMVLVTLAHLLVWGVSHLSSVLRGRKALLSKRRPYHWCGGGAGLLCGLLLQFPLLILVTYALKSTDELFLFPPRFFPQNPSSEGFAGIYQFQANVWGLPGRSWNIPYYLLIALFLFILLVLPTAVGITFLQGRGKRAAAVVWFLTCAACPFVLQSYLWKASLSNSLLLSSAAAYTSSPLLPLSVLLTVWILRKSTAGCSSFSVWFRQRKRLVFTIASLLITALSTSVSVIYAMQPLIYNEFKRTPIQILSQLSSGGLARMNVACAASLLLLGVGVLVLLLMAAVMLTMNRVSRISVTEEQ